MEAATIKISSAKGINSVLTVGLIGLAINLSSSKNLIAVGPCPLLNSCLIHYIF